MIFINTFMQPKNNENGTKIINYLTICESTGLMILFPGNHFFIKNKRVYIRFFQLESQSVMSIDWILYATTWLR